ncbi:MAG: helix-turn-helix transcriptional regulator [Lacisediminihabitans sp.]
MQNALARLRQDAGLTQEALGTALGVSRQTIISIEKGKFDPSLPLAFRMAELFDCRIEDIFTPDSFRRSAD